MADKKKGGKDSLKVKNLPSASAKGAGSVKGGMRAAPSTSTTEATLCKTTRSNLCCSD